MCVFYIAKCVGGLKPTGRCLYIRGGKEFTHVNGTGGLDIFWTFDLILISLEISA